MSNLKGLINKANADAATIENFLKEYQESEIFKDVSPKACNDAKSNLQGKISVLMQKLPEPLPNPPKKGGKRRKSQRRKSHRKKKSDRKKSKKRR